MDAVFLKLLNMSVTGGIMILIIIVLRFLLKSSPKFMRLVLWGIVGLRLIVPFSIESSFSLLPTTDPISYSSFTINDPVNYDAPAAENAPGMEALTPAPAQSANHTESENDAAAVISTQRAKLDVSAGSVSFLTVLSIVWISGIAAVLLAGLINILKLRLKLRFAVETEKGIYLCDHIPSPFLIGIFHPKIFLPSGLPDEEKRYILLHEKTHIRRADNLIKLIAFIILCVHWFNPLVWLSFALLCKDIELSCDESVIKKGGNDFIAAYSQTLLNCASGRKHMLLYPVAFGEVGIKERVKNVLSYKKPGFWIILAAVVVSAVLAVCFLTDPRANETPLPEETADTAEPVAEDSLIGIVNRFNNVMMGTGEHSYALLRYLGYRAEEIGVSPETINILQPTDIDYGDYKARMLEIITPEFFEYLRSIDRVLLDYNGKVTLWGNQNNLLYYESDIAEFVFSVNKADSGAENEYLFRGGYSRHPELSKRDSKYSFGGRILIDETSDGYRISACPDLMSLYNVKVDMNLLQIDLSSVLQKYDKNASGYIEWEEFPALTSEFLGLTGDHKLVYDTFLQQHENQRKENHLPYEMYFPSIQILGEYSDEDGNHCFVIWETTDYHYELGFALMHPISFSNGFAGWGSGLGRMVFSPDKSELISFEEPLHSSRQITDEICGPLTELARQINNHESAEPISAMPKERELVNLYCRYYFPEYGENFDFYIL